MGINKDKYQPKICPRCGQSFICYCSVDCWCFEISIPEKLNEYLENNYESCLCENCIRELKEELV